MRLIFVSHSLPPADNPSSNIGGMQRVAQDLFDALRQRDDIELIPIVLRSSWAETHRRVVPFLFRVYRSVGRIARHDGADAVLFSSMVTASLSVPLRKKLNRAGIRSASIVHGLDVTTPAAAYQWFVPRVFGALDTVFPISRATRDACIERGLNPEKARVVPNGISMARFANDGPTGRDRSTLAQIAAAAGVDTASLQSERSLLLASVGRHVKRKGFVWFIDNVLPTLPEHVSYWLAGEGPEDEEIRSVISRHGLQDRIHLLGRVSDELLAALYRGADLFVMPNIRVPGDMEGFGVVLLEAALNGMPAVAAGIEGILDVVADGQNGVLVESGNAAAFREAIAAFDSDRARLTDLSRSAREYTSRNFAWASVADRYIESLRV